jgi:hypothetical protein
MLIQQFTQENSSFLQSSVWLNMSYANKLNPVAHYCPTYSKHILCALCGMLAEQTWFRGNMCLNVIPSRKEGRKEGRKVTNESGKTVIMWQRELFIWFHTLSVVLKWHCCYVISGSYSYSPFLRITFPQMSHFIQATVASISSLHFSLGCTISSFWFIRCYPNERESVHLYRLLLSYVPHRALLNSIPVMYLLWLSSPESNTSVLGL